MKVTHNDIEGELVSGVGHVSFRPMGDPYGLRCLTIHYPEVSFGSSDEDDSSILIKGMVAMSGVGQPGSALYRRVVESFYPVWPTTIA